MKRAVVIVLGLLGLVLSPRPAAADRDRISVLVLDFEGERAEAARDGAVRALGPRFTSVRLADATRTASELGVDLATDAGRARVGAALGVQIFVLGTVSPARRGAPRLRIRIVGPEGELFADVEARLPRGRDGPRAARRLVAGALATAVSALEPPPSAPVQGGAETSTPPVPVPEPRHEPEAQPSPPARSSRAGAAVSRPRAGPEPRAERARPYVRLLAGSELVLRSAYVSFENQPSREYYVPGLLAVCLHVDTFPFAGSRAFWRRLWFGVDATRSIGWRVHDWSDHEYLALMNEATAGLGVVVLEEPVSILVEAGGGFDDLLVERNPVFPSVHYLHARLGLGTIVPIFGDALGFSARAAGRYALGAGGRLESDFGALGRIWAGELTLGLQGSLFGGLAYEVAAGFRRYWLPFRGEGTLGAGSRGFDQRISGHVLVGWAL